VIDQYQQTTHTPEALMRLTETYLALGVPIEAEKAAAVLGRNYPGTPWYQRAYKLMQEHPVKPLAPIATGAQIVPAGTPGALPAAGLGETPAIPGSPGNGGSGSAAAGGSGPVGPAGTTRTTPGN
jgi:outer membrane protein assembly factor BamD